jgi:hypothetical protein
MARGAFRMARDTGFVNPIHSFETTTRWEAGVIRDTSRMAMNVVPVILLPTMDSERFERCSFSLQDHESLLTITMTDLPPFIVHFHRLRWHRFTPHAECLPGMILGSDMAVAEVIESPALRHYLAREQVAPDDARNLRHYRIYLGKGGCHEAFAKSAYASGAGSMSRAFASFTNGVRLRFRSLSAGQR